MESVCRKAAFIVCLALAGVSGCIVISCDNGSFKARCERTVEVEQPMASGLRLVADTEFGDVHVIGEEIDVCRLAARIHVQAETDELAKQIADKIEVSLVSSPRGMEVVIRKPEQKPRYSSGVALTIHLPAQTSLDIRTSFGTVEVADIQGDVKLHTSFGKVKLADVQGDIKADTSFGDMYAERVAGPLKLNTSHGAIRCSAITSGSLALDTSFGNVTVGGLQSEGPLTATVNTSHGNIDFACPEGFGGRVDMKTSFGKIRTEQPITVKGDFGKEQLNGTIGSGPGTITLRTSFGNISLN